MIAPSRYQEVIFDLEEQIKYDIAIFKLHFSCDDEINILPTSMSESLPLASKIEEVIVGEIDYFEGNKDSKDFRYMQEILIRIRICQKMVLLFNKLNTNQILTLEDEDETTNLLKTTTIIRKSKFFESFSPRFLSGLEQVSKCMDTPKSSNLMLTTSLFAQKVKHEFAKHGIDNIEQAREVIANIDTDFRIKAELSDIVSEYETIRSNVFSSSYDGYQQDEEDLDLDDLIQDLSDVSLLNPQMLREISNSNSELLFSDDEDVSAFNGECCTLNGKIYFKGVVNRSIKRDYESKKDFIAVPGLKFDIEIKCSQRDCSHRALLRDEVIVELFHEDLWNQNGKAKNDDPLLDPVVVPLLAPIQRTQSETTSASIQFALWGDTDKVLENFQNKYPYIPPQYPDEINETNRKIHTLSRKPTGRIVKIIERRNKPKFAGKLEIDSRASHSSKYLLLSPFDNRYPKISISASQMPFGFEDINALDFDKLAVIVEFDSWPITSKYPYGVNVTLLPGELGSLESEIKSELITKGLDFGDEYPDSGFTSTWTVPSFERTSRKDLTHVRCFTVDPYTSKDMDDAISITDLGDGTYEVGVYIADVTYFVSEGSDLDKEAFRRSTSVYFANNIVAMLPPILSENLCSLNPNTERLAFAYFSRLDKYGNLVSGNSLLPLDDQSRTRAHVLKDSNEWFGHVIIKSCAKLDYGTAQLAADKLEEIFQAAEDDNTIRSLESDPSIFESLFTEATWECSRRPLPGSPHTCYQLAVDIRTLLHITLERRKNRFRCGAVEIHDFSIHFRLDSTTGNPTEATGAQKFSTNKMIEELMLLANFLTAQVLVKHIGVGAFLRKEPSPDKNSVAYLYADIKKLFSEFDISFNSSNSRRFQDSLQAMYSHSGVTEIAKEAVSALIRTTMSAAKYVPASSDFEEWNHYLLSVPYYTHFTSPIRRYADIVVHRLLDLILANPSDAELPILSDDNLSKLAVVADQCTRYHGKAKLWRVDTIYFSFFLSINHPQGLEVEATVIECWKNKITLLDNKFKRMKTYNFPQNNDDLGIVAVYQALDSDRFVLIFDKIKGDANKGLRILSIKRWKSILAVLSAKTTAPTDFNFRFLRPEPFHTLVNTDDEDVEIFNNINRLHDALIFFLNEHPNRFISAEFTNRSYYNRKFFESLSEHKDLLRLLYALTLAGLIRIFDEDFYFRYGTWNNNQMLYIMTKSYAIKLAEELHVFISVLPKRSLSSLEMKKFYGAQPLAKIIFTSVFVNPKNFLRQFSDLFQITDKNMNDNLDATKHCQTYSISCVGVTAAEIALAHSFKEYILTQSNNSLLSSKMTPFYAIRPEAKAIFKDRFGSLRKFLSYFPEYFVVGPEINEKVGFPIHCTN